MDKNIPIYFDSIIIDSPFQEISQDTPNIGRLKVRVFSKYGNRNGSYITDAVADQLIQSAIGGNTPVVGFFDPETNSWASHTGPMIANAYGYVEDFLGWQSFDDTDGVARDYAVFSVVLFTDYFDEARKILGQNQSMELDPASITGEWADIENQPYYVYKTAKMLGFCVIGDHEPCFSVSSFFAKNDENYNNQYEKFASLLSDLKVKVEATEKDMGGEHPMDVFENQVAVEEIQEAPEVEVNVVEETTAPENFEKEEEQVEVTVEETEVTEPTEFELLQQRFEELQASYDALQERFDQVSNEFSAFQTSANEELETLRNQNTELQASVQNYEAQAIEIEENRKNILLEKYEKMLDAEEIAPIREASKDYSYEELESKLAVMFVNAKMNGSEEVQKVPLPEPQESQFALLMKKYRKN